MFLHILLLGAVATQWDPAVDCSTFTSNTTCWANRGCDWNSGCSEFECSGKGSESECISMLGCDWSDRSNNCDWVPECSTSTLPWEHAQLRHICGSCSAETDSVVRDGYKTCGIYCNSMGRECVSASYRTDSDNVCALANNVTCDFDMKSLDDTKPICTCGGQLTTSAPQGCASNPPSNWNSTGYTAICPNYDCSAYVWELDSDMSCDSYCQAQSLQCMRSWEPAKGCFDAQFERECDMTGGEILCECGNQCAADAAKCGADAKQAFRQLQNVSICSVEVERILTKANRCIGELYENGCQQVNVTNELLQYELFAQEIGTLACSNGEPTVCKDLDSAIQFVTSRTKLENITTCSGLLAVADCDTTVGNTGFQVRDGCCESCADVSGSQCNDNDALVSLMMQGSFLETLITNCSTAYQYSGCDTVVGGIYTARDACCQTCQGVDSSVRVDYNGLIEVFVDDSTANCSVVGSTYGCEMCYEGFCLWQACGAMCENTASCMCPNGLYGGSYVPFEAAKSGQLINMYDGLVPAVSWCAYNASAYDSSQTYAPSTSFGTIFFNLLHSDLDQSQSINGVEYQGMQYDWAYFSHYHRQVFFDNGTAENDGIHWGPQLTLEDDFSTWCADQGDGQGGSLKDETVTCITINGVLTAREECSIWRDAFTEIAPHCCEEPLDYSCQSKAEAECGGQSQNCSCLANVDLVALGCDEASQQKFTQYIDSNCSQSLNIYTMTTTTGAPVRSCTREMDCSHVGEASGVEGSCACTCDLGYTGTNCSTIVTVVAEVSFSGITIEEFQDNANDIKEKYATSIGKPAYMVSIASVTNSTGRRFLSAGVDVVFKVMCESQSEKDSVQTTVQSSSFDDDLVSKITEISAFSSHSISAVVVMKTPCAPSACSGNGYTTDMDDSDGCVCVCDTGYSGNDCSVDDSITTTTTTTTEYADQASTTLCFSAILLAYITWL